MEGCLRVPREASPLSASCPVGLGLDAEAQACPHLPFPCLSQALPFSHLILATGSTGFFPGKFNKVCSQQEAIQAYEDMVKQVSCPLTRGRAVREEGGLWKSRIAVGDLGLQQGDPRRYLGL